MKNRISYLPSFFLFISITSAYCTERLADIASKIDSLETDSAKVNFLLKESDLNIAYEDRITYARYAYNIAKSSSSQKLLYEAMVHYGSKLAAIDLDSGIFLIDQAIDHAQKTSQLDLYAKSLFRKGLAYELNFVRDSALYYYEKSYDFSALYHFHPTWSDAAYGALWLHKIAGRSTEALKWCLKLEKAAQKEENWTRVGESYNIRGHIYEGKGVYHEALELYFKAKEIAEDRSILQLEIMTNNMIGMLYDKMGDLESAIHYYSSALEKSRIDVMGTQEAPLLNNLAYVSLRNGDRKKAKELYTRAASLLKETGETCSYAYPLEGLGSAFMEELLLDSASKYLHMSHSIGIKCQDAYLMSISKRSLGTLHLKQKEYKASIQYLKESLAIAESAQLSDEIEEALLALFAYYEEVGNVGTSLFYLKKHKTFTDSIAKNHNEAKASFFAAEYALKKEIKKIELDNYEAERELALRLSEQKATKRLFIIATCFFLLLGLVLFRAYTIIKHKNNRLKELNQEKNRLMGVVAHDLKNPLSIVITLLPMLKKSAKRPDLQNKFDDYFQLVGDSTTKMSNMIDRVLDVSAVEHMKLNLKVEKTNLGDLLSRIAINFDVQARQKMIKIENNIAQNADFISEVDPNFLEQAIDNLISNAIKYSQKGKRIILSLKEKDTENIIEVHDEGPGISEQDQEKIFKPFTTSSNKATGQETSVGLGLSTSMKFINAMGGSISLQSTIGIGTTFIIALKKAM